MNELLNTIITQYPDLALIMCLERTVFCECDILWLFLKGVKKVRSTFQMVILICKQAASTEQFTQSISRGSTFILYNIVNSLGHRVYERSDML